MKFKVKALKHRGDSSESEDDGQEDASASEESAAATKELLEAASALIAEKSAILSRMVNRRAAEKKRLSEMDASGLPQDLIVAEATSLVEDFEDVSKLHSELVSISKLVLAVSEWIPLDDDIKARALSIGASVPDTGVSGGDESSAKEEQLAKREEMLDRKIKGYATRKKELMEQEASLAEKLKELEAERTEFEKVRQETVDSGAKDWEEREREIVRRITILQTVMAGVLGKANSRESGNMDDGLSDLEASIKTLLDKNSDMEGKLGEARDYDADMKELLSVLDKLLGKLPEDAIQEFTGSDAYKLYEKVLDRYGI